MFFCMHCKLIALFVTLKKFFQCPLRTTKSYSVFKTKKCFEISVNQILVLSQISYKLHTDARVHVYVFNYVKCLS